MRELGRTGLVVSAVGMGCNKLGSLSARQSRRSAIRLVRQAVDGGVRLFDTADAYGSGTSESLLGEALRTEQSVVVATKIGYRFVERTSSAQAVHAAVGAVRGRVPGARRKVQPYSTQDFSGAYVRSAVEGSLRRLKRDRIDILQFHGPPETSRTELPEVVMQLIAAGDVATFGVGCERLEVAQSWLGVSGLASIQLPFGVLDPQAAAQLIPQIHEAGVGVIARGVLGGGVIARFLRGQDPGIEPERVRRLERLRELAAEHDVDLAQLAVWFATSSEAIDVTLLGVSNETQLASALRYAAADKPLPDVFQRMAAIAADQT